jgi:N-acetylglucosamine transport system permease protein
MPLIWEQIKVSVVNIVITTLNGSFVIVQLMTNGGQPDNTTQVMGSYLYRMAFQQYHFGYGAAIGVMILIVSLITTLILQRIMRQEAIEMH